MRSLCDGSGLAALSERQLLDRFLGRGDELAFEMIVSRHGPIVAEVCRSVLSNLADVDDAFQATFLVLLRKAGSLRDRDQLGPWLHGVARGVALQARGEAVKRRARERAGIEVDPADPGRTGSGIELRELAGLIHAELDRLSPLERSAVILCDLEGLSHQEAADQLGWALGTVKTRVARGRDRLRVRLSRRGVSLSSAALVAALAGNKEGAQAIR